MKWFGISWGAPVNDDRTHTATPVGDLCAHCQQPVQEGERGLILPFMGGPDDPPELPYHLRCFSKCLGIDEQERRNRPPAS